MEKMTPKQRRAVFVKAEQAKPQQAMKNSGGKVPLSMLPPHALVEIAKVRKFGADKYATWDWMKSRNHLEYLDAILRHLLAWQAGENNDPESGLPHLAHAACGLMFLLEFERSGAGTDDRPDGLVMPEFD